MVGYLLHFIMSGLFLFSYCSAMEDICDDYELTEMDLQEFKHYPIFDNLKEQVEMQFDALDLLSAWRFDVMAKYIYAKHRDLKVKNEWAKNLYAEHLHVWGNFKESWPKKEGLEDYLNAFHKILDSIKNEGFSTKYSVVPIDKRKIISNGGHRVAASLYFRRPVVCKYYSSWQAPIASAAFFKANQKHVKGGLAEKYLDAMALEYAALKKNTYVVHIFPIAPGKDAQIRAILDEHGLIVYEKNVMLRHEGPFNLTRLIYEGEQWLGDWKNDFAGARRDAKVRFPNNKHPLRIYLFECESLEKVKAAKQKIRELFEVGNFSIHINDSHAQTMLSAQTFFNQNSIHVLNNSKHAKMPNLEKFLAEYRQWLVAKGLNQENFCVDSSSVLSAYGIRDCRDLDFLHHGLLQKKYALRAGNIADHTDSLAHHVFELDDIVYNPENFFYYKGLKFSALHVVKGMKKKRNEEKDRKDLALIEKHFKTL